MTERVIRNEAELELAQRLIASMTNHQEENMKYRISQWLDTSNLDSEELPMKFGIQGNKGNGWQHIAENGKALIFDTSSQAAAKVKELRAKAA